MMAVDIQRLENHTDHDIIIVDNDGNEVVRFPSKGKLRIEFLPDTEVTRILGVPFRNRQKYDTKGIVTPPRKPGTIYIVSQYVWNAFPDRDDFCYPDGKIKKDGRVIGCQFLRLNR